MDSELCGPIWAKFCGILRCISGKVLGYKFCGSVGCDPVIADPWFWSDLVGVDARFVF